MMQNVRMYFSKLLKSAIFFGFFLSQTNLFAFEVKVRSPEIYSMRQAYMGMAYTALANDEMLLTANPAGLGVKRKLFQALDYDPVVYFLPLQAEFPIFDDTDIKQVAEDGQGILVASQPLLEFSYLTSNWGISLFTKASFQLGNAADYDFLKRSLISQSSIYTGLHYAYKIPSFSVLGEDNLHLGIGVKLFFISQLNTSLSIREMTDDLIPVILANAYNKSFSIYNVGNYLGQKLNMFDGVGFGLDIGALWEVLLPQKGHQVNVGLAVLDAPGYAINTEISSFVIEGVMKLICDDLNSSLKNNKEITNAGITGNAIDCSHEPLGEDTFLTPNLKFGVAYLPPNFVSDTYLTDWVIAIDLHHLFDSDYSMVDRYHIGTSINIFDFTTVEDEEDTATGYRMNTGFGINQSSFNVGLIFHLNRFSIGYAYLKEKFVGFDIYAHRHAFKLAWYW